MKCVHKLNSYIFEDGVEWAVFISHEWITGDKTELLWYVTNAVWFITNAGEVISYLIMSTEMIFETPFYSPFNHVTRLLARDIFIDFSRHKKVKFYITRVSTELQDITSHTSIIWVLTLVWQLHVSKEAQLFCNWAWNQTGDYFFPKTNFVKVYTVRNSVIEYGVSYIVFLSAVLNTGCPRGFRLSREQIWLDQGHNKRDNLH